MDTSFQHCHINIDLHFCFYAAYLNQFEENLLTVKVVQADIWKLSNMKGMFLGYDNCAFAGTE